MFVSGQHYLIFQMSVFSSWWLHKIVWLLKTRRKKENVCMTTQVKPVLPFWSVFLESFKHAYIPIYIIKFILYRFLFCFFHSVLYVMVSPALKKFFRNITFICYLFNIWIKHSFTCGYFIFIMFPSNDNASVIPDYFFLG